MQRRWTARIVMVLAVAAVAAGASWTFAVWLFEGSLGGARANVDRHRFAAAREWLVAHARGRPENAEVAYLLGVCERGLGRPAAAVAAGA
jgi:hypothetical protein